MIRLRVSLVLAFGFFIMLGTAQRASAQTEMNSSPDSTHVETNLMQREAWGVRTGFAHRNLYPDLKPIFNPYYEVPVGKLLVAAELMLTYLRPEEIQFLHLPDKFHFDAYGFNFKLKSIWGSGVLHPEASAGAELEVLTDKVSVGLPLTIGGLYDVSRTLQLELAFIFTPLFYLGQGTSNFFGVEVGFRFPEN
jgi:hypothetical protein